METTNLLLIASIGSIAVLLILYSYIFMFERRFFLVLWFAGWFIIALNYLLDARFSYILRENQPIFYLSLGSFFYANLLITWGTILFLKTKVKKVYFLGIGMIWLIFFILFSMQSLPPVHMIQYTYLSVFALFTLVGVVMIRLAKHYGKLILLLGLLDIAWVANNLIFTLILEMANKIPYIVSQIILLLNAIGLIQLYFKEQNNTIRKGLDQITYLTFHDGLTGLYNKTYFDNKLQELEGRKKYLPISLIVGDMNSLKIVNDVFGHHEGDNRLREMALIIQQSCRPDDIIARWGGDEFAIILPNTDKETAKSIREKISKACKSIHDADYLLSISLGVATKTDEEGSLSMVLKEAEELMYKDKLIEGRKIKEGLAETIEKILHENAHEMKGHIERLQLLAKEFARVLDLSAEDLNILLLAAKLHDIGKIGISKDLILKRSLLKDEEAHIMKKHVEIGYRIAHASGEFAYLADIILYHHEWWNGNGYPQGLKGEEIPLMSRIIAILNAFDVMTHWQQESRPAMTSEEAIQELEDRAGSQFDPHLVQLFVQMVKEKQEKEEENI